MSLRQHIMNVQKFMSLAGQSTPTEPTIPSLDDRILRAKLIMEEATELIKDGLGLGFDYTDNRFSFYEMHQPDLVATMDGAIDLLWVGVTGVGVLCGVDIEPLIEEVDRSNLSKFIDGHRRDDGKWVKGPSYSPADIKGKIAPIGIGSSYYAILNDSYIDSESWYEQSWYIVDKKFWDENGYVDDSLCLDLSKYGLVDIMEACYEFTEELSIEEEKQRLKLLGFTILENNV